MGGLEVASAVKAADLQTPVILMTGWGTTLVEEEVRKKGVDFIISKPFQLEEMKRVLHQVLVQRRVGGRSRSRVQS